MPARKIPPPVRGPLAPRAIAEMALDLIDRDGLEELSMRRLGSALGVEAMALYHHFSNKAEVLDAVLELLIEQLTLPAADGEPPLGHLRRTFEHVRRLALAHPRAFILIPTRRFRTPVALAYYEQLLQIFRDAGFDGEASARYFRVLAGFATGAGLAEIGSRALQPDASAIILEEFRDPERFPRVTEAVPHLRVAKLHRIFSFGLDLIFDAMERELRAGSAAGNAKRKKRSRADAARPRVSRD